MTDFPFRITLYSRGLVRRGWIGAPSRVECLLRHNAVGQCAVTVAADHPRVVDVVEPGARAVVHYLDEQIMSGRVGRVEGTGPRAQAAVTFHIEDDFRLLGRLLGWPNPSGPIGDQGAATAYNTVTGPAESVVKTLVSRNAARSRPVLTVAGDAGRGAPVQVSVRMHPLADRLLPAVDAAGIGVSVRQDGAGLTVDCYEPRKHPTVLSEESGVVVGWAWTTVAPAATRVVAGGQGEGTAREFVSLIDADREVEWGETIEVFRDARDTDDAAVLAQRAQETLTEGAPTTGLSLDLTESRGFAYGRTVRVGDKVTTRIAPGAAITDVLREARIVWDTESGLTVTPVVGERQDDPSSVLRSTINALTKGIRDLRAR